MFSHDPDDLIACVDSLLILSQPFEDLSKADVLRYQQEFKTVFKRESGTRA